MVRVLRHVGACACLVAFGCAPRSSILAAPTLDVPVQRVPGSAPVAAAADEPAPDDGRSAGDLVDVEWKGSWWPAVLLERRGAAWLIHYEGYDETFDEVASAPRIRDRAPLEEEPEELEGEEADP